MKAAVVIFRYNYNQRNDYFITLTNSKKSLRDSASVISSGQNDITEGLIYLLEKLTFNDEVLTIIYI